MLSNVVFIKDLQGKFLFYLMGIIPMLLVTLIPAREIRISKLGILAASFLSAAGILAIGVFGLEYSPLYHVYALGLEQRDYQAMVSEAKDLQSDGTEFYRPGLEDFIKKPDTLPEHPNIILIFAEGLSENIIYDDRNIMPNLRAFGQETLRFENYYNHTFATLRGLIGQLYSGYQLENFDTNSLCSMQSILQAQGYQTSFINTEPTNREFTEYLENLRFDEVVTDMERVDDNGSYIHDKEAFELLFDTMEAKHETGTPFFTVIYTFGTHMSLDTADERFDGGSDALLNRFYDLDCQFARFLERFRESPAFEDTLLIFTTDHATYADDDFLAAFPEYDRVNPCLDTIPLYFYHIGVEPGKVDAAGRNSLDLAPAVMDYVDISVPNYFLGQSLFAPQGGAPGLDTIFHESASVLSTEHGQIGQLTESAYSDFRTTLIRYSSAKGVTDIVPISEAQIVSEVSADGTAIEVTLRGAEEYTKVWFPVWSDVDWQDDLVWHEAEKDEDGSFHCTIDLSQHSGGGIYYIHAYGEDKAPENLLAVSWVYVSGPEQEGESGQKPETR